MACVFCDIVAKKRPARIVYEDDRVLAIRDRYPQAPVHVLIIPKKHISTIAEMETGDEELSGHLHRVAVLVARQESIYDCGFRIIINSGPDAGQMISHLHLHLLGGRRMGWPPG